MDEYQKMMKPEYYESRSYKYSERERIPHVSHRVWLTYPYYPRELLNVLVDPYLQ